MDATLNKSGVQEPRAKGIMLVVMMHIGSNCTEIVMLQYQITEWSSCDLTGRQQCSYIQWLCFSRCWTGEGRMSARCLSITDQMKTAHGRNTVLMNFWINFTWEHRKKQRADVPPSPNAALYPRLISPRGQIKYPESVIHVSVGRYLSFFNKSVLVQWTCWEVWFKEKRIETCLKSRIFSKVVGIQFILTMVQINEWPKHVTLLPYFGGWGIKIHIYQCVLKELYVLIWL